MHRTVILLFLLVPGCFEWPSSPPPPPPSAEDAYLIWQDSPEGLTTLWLSATGERVSEHAGLVLSWGGSLWRLESSTSPHRALDCSCVMRGPEPFASDIPPTECTSDSTIATATLHGPGALSVPLLAAPAPESWQSDHEQSIQIHGSLGPYLMYAVSQSSYFCGAAHGTSASQFYVFDLRRPSAGAHGLELLLSSSELRVLSPDLLESARARLVTAEGEGSGLLDPTASPRLTALSTDWTPTGLSVTAQLTFEVCYACGDGLWSAYTRSEQHPLPSVPSAFAEHVMPLPSVVSSWALASGEAGRWGYSVLEGTPEALTAARSSIP